MSVADVVLSPLRRVARFVGDAGGLLVMTLSFGGSMTMAEHGGSPTARLLAILGLAATCFAIFSRNSNNDGHKAMRRLREASGPDGDDARYARWLGTTPDADPAAIQSAAKRLMIANHPDKGGKGDLDMALIIQVRDHLIHRVDERGTGPDAAALLRAWRLHAGISGQAWGWLLPSDRLLALRTATGESLWPRTPKGIAAEDQS